LLSIKKFYQWNLGKNPGKYFPKIIAKKIPKNKNHGFSEKKIIIFVIRFKK
jgi:hypothetical protein